MLTHAARNKLLIQGAGPRSHAYEILLVEV